MSSVQVVSELAVLFAVRCAAPATCSNATTTSAPTTLLDD